MNVTRYPDNCVDCGKRRVCDAAGQCQECAQADRDAEVVMVDENGDEWVAGGFAL